MLPERLRSFASAAACAHAKTGSDRLVSRWRCPHPFVAKSNKSTLWKLGHKTCLQNPKYMRSLKLSFDLSLLLGDSSKNTGIQFIPSNTLRIASRSFGSWSNGSGIFDTVPIQVVLRNNETPSFLLLAINDSDQHAFHSFVSESLVIVTGKW